MDQREVGRCWDGNAEAWTRLSRAGYDVCRDRFNSPAFFAMLPDVAGLAGLDIGCGEGHNTRLLAQRGARLAAIDISPRFVAHARAADRAEPLGIEYALASALELPFAAGRFDFVTGFMSFMDIPRPELVLAEAHRVLAPGGFLQFSITHPCFDTPHRRPLHDEQGRCVAVEIGGYFENLDGDVSEWTFSAAPPAEQAEWAPFRVPRFTRTLSQWLNALLDLGLDIERVTEPRPDSGAAGQGGGLDGALAWAYFLIIRVRKPLRPTAGKPLPRGG